ncbi:MAG: MFS transporter [Sulfurospirillum sp.]|nr:MFS transporter [Sulfurospirillum sp.]MBL0703000.1 MFS transporter [Sulfurospirillum sp.]
MKTINKKTKVTLLLLSTITVLSNVAIVTMIPNLSTIFKDIENIELLSRLMITLPSLSIAIFAPFLGIFVNSVGKKKSVLIALLAFSLFGTSGLYLNNIYEILVSRFLFGISIAILMIVNTTLIGDYFKNEDRNKFIGLQSAFISIGGIFFIISGGFLSDISWRYPFAIYSLAIFLYIFVVKYLVEYNSNSMEIKEERHLLNNNLWYIYFFAFIFMLVFYILPTQMPFLIINVFHANGVLAGGIIATAFIFNALGGLSFVKLKKHFTFSKIYMIGMSIVAIGFILIGFISNVYLFFLTSPIIGFGGGILMANMTTWMLHVSHHTKRVKSSSFLTSSLFLGQFFSPLVTHPVLNYFGVQDFFIAIGVILLSIIFVTILSKIVQTCINM